MLLSVIVPVYNVEKYLDECVQSILRQTFDDFELLLINDGSSDSSLAICRKYEQEDSRIKVFDKKNGGQSSARNLGLDKALGQFVSFIDSDDYISQDFFEAGIASLESSNNADFVVLPYQRDNCDFDNHYTLSLSTVETSMERLFSLWINGKLLTNYMCDKIWRYDLFKNLRFPEGMIYEDRYIFADILTRSKGVKFVNRGCYYYRMRDGQTTRLVTEHSLRSMIESDKHILDVMPNPLQAERTFVKHRLFSTFIEFYQKFGYDEGVFRKTLKAIGKPAHLWRNNAPTSRMLIYSMLGGG